MAMPEDGILVTSHSRLLIPSYQSQVTSHPSKGGNYELPGIYQTGRGEFIQASCDLGVSAGTEDLLSRRPRARGE